MAVASQKIPPLRNIHAECKKLKSLPSNTQLYAEDAQVIRITATKRINPRTNSDHLSMLNKSKVDLKRFL